MVLRSVVLELLRFAGVYRIARARRRCDIVILTIHGVMDERPGQTWRPFRNYLPPARLELCIKALKRHYRFVSLEAAVEMLAKRRPLEPNCIAVTLDDGYRNHATAAWPILRRSEIPATFFVVTSQFTVRTPFWFDRLDYALQHLPYSMSELQIEFSGKLRTYAVADTHARYEARLSLRTECKKHDLDTIELIVGQIEGRATSSLADVFATDDWTSLMTAEDVRRLAAEGADIGSHTVDHALLGRLDDESAFRQLERSKRAIEDLTGRECAHVCYPNGDVNARTADLARRAGYRCGVTTCEGSCRRGDDMHLLNRVHLPTRQGVSELLANVNGVAQALTRMKGFRPW